MSSTSNTPLGVIQIGAGYYLILKDCFTESKVVTDEPILFFHSICISPKLLSPVNDKIGRHSKHPEYPHKPQTFFVPNPIQPTPFTALTKEVGVFQQCPPEQQVHFLDPVRVVQVEYHIH